MNRAPSCDVIRALRGGPPWQKKMAAVGAVADLSDYYSLKESDGRKRYKHAEIIFICRPGSICALQQELVKPNRCLSRLQVNSIIYIYQTS